MRPKLAAILVAGILTVSMVVTAAAAVGQVVNGDSDSPGSAQGQYGPRLADGSFGNETGGNGTGEGSRDNTLARTFKLVCPFH